MILQRNDAFKENLNLDCHSLAVPSLLLSLAYRSQQQHHSLRIPVRASRKVVK